MKMNQQRGPSGPLQNKLDEINAGATHAVIELA